MIYDLQFCSQFAGFFACLNENLNYGSRKWNYATKNYQGAYEGSGGLGPKYGLMPMLSLLSIIIIT